MKYGFPPAKLAAIGLLVSFIDSISVSDTAFLAVRGQLADDRRPFRRPVRLLGLKKATGVNFQDGTVKLKPRFAFNNTIIVSTQNCCFVGLTIQAE